MFLRLYYGRVGQQIISITKAIPALRIALESFLIAR
jgi:hypothetical protein